MLSTEDFEKVAQSIDRDNPPADRLNNLGIDQEALRLWLLDQLGDSYPVAYCGMGIELGILFAKELNEVHT
jgi:hypothetical protein